MQSSGTVPFAALHNYILGLWLSMSRTNLCIAAKSCANCVKSGVTRVAPDHISSVKKRFVVLKQRVAAQWRVIHAIIAPADATPLGASFS